MEMHIRTRSSPTPGHVASRWWIAQQYLRDLGRRSGGGGVSNYTHMILDVDGLPYK